MTPHVTTGVRLDALRRLPQLDLGVTPYVRETVRLPARLVLERGVGTTGTSRRPRVELLHPPQVRGRARRRARPQVVPASVCPLRLAGPDGSIGASLLVGDSFSSLQQALRQRLEETGDAELRRLVEHLRADKQALGSDAVIETMQRRGRHGPESGPQLLWIEGEFEDEHPVEVQAPDGSFLRAPSLRDTPVGVVVGTRQVEIGGRLVPRRVFVLQSGARGRPLVHDGLRLVRGVLDVDRIPEEVLDALDADGAVEVASLRDLLPPGHLGARCVVRVPGRAELAGLPAKPGRPRLRLLGRPAYALDARAPIELTGKEPVIDDPQAGAWVAQRVSLGTFHPSDEVARRLDPARHPEAPGWLVLADARLGLGRA